MTSPISPMGPGPMRVPGSSSTRRPRGSLGLADEISHLSLSEVRDRIARNERVLQSSLFSTSPTAGTGFVSPISPPTQAGPSSPREEDPVRDRLLAVRTALLQRESELLADSVGSMSLNNAQLSTSPRSGKARAMETIRQGEAGRLPSAISLPIQQSLELGERDFDNQTAARLANLNLLQPKRRHIDDELGRAAAAAQYARAHVNDDENDIFDSDEAYTAASVYASGRHDRGNGLPMSTAKARRAEGFDDDMRSDDESVDDDEFPEGNDEYSGAGEDSQEAGPR